MNPTIAPLNDLLNLNARLFVNCLDGVDGEAAQKRIDDRTNSLAFVAVHVLDARFFLARCLGVEAENPFKAMLDPVENIEDVTGLPSLEAVRDAWTEITGTLMKRLATMTERDLERPSPMSFPLECGESALGALAFLTEHESFHIGQMALLRKWLGYEAMKYES